MKKKELMSLAILGISTGLMISGCEKSDQVPPGNKLAADEQLGADMQSFYSSLSVEGQKKFMELDAQHKMMAIEMSQQTCNGKNKCSGMGGCSTSQHGCGGENGCKGQGGAPVKDPNKAVEIQHKNQMGQRAKTNGGMGGTQSAEKNSY